MYPLLLSALLASSASPAPRVGAEASGEAYARRLSLYMRTSDSPRVRALSTLMLDPEWNSKAPEVLQAESGKRLREAAAKAPTDALVQYLWSYTGPKSDGCDVARPCPERATALARLQPRNGAAWLPLVNEAEKSGDAKAVDAALASLASSDHFDDMYVDAWLAWQDILRRVPLTDDELRVAGAGQEDSTPNRNPEDIEMSMASSNAAMVVFSGAMQGLVHACDRNRHPDASPQRFEDCARAGRMMAQTGTSMLSEAIGHALVRRAALASASDREAEHAYLWRQSRLPGAYTLMDQDPTDGRQYFTDLATTRREASAQELLLTRHAISLQPPPEWQPPNYDGR